MTRDRFESILGILHLPDPHQDYAGNRLGKIANFVAQLNKSFQAAWQLGRNLFIDETLIPCKGRTFLKQYIETKPFKWTQSCGSWLAAVLDMCGNLVCMLGNKEK